MSRFLFGVLTGAGLLFFAMHFHVVRGNHRLFVVPKVTNNLSDTFVDTRGFELADWREHKLLAAAIIRRERTIPADRPPRDSVRSTVSELISALLPSTQAALADAEFGR